MLAALIIIGVLGIDLPVALWMIARWRRSVPEKPYAPGEVNQWLLSEYGLGSRDGVLVQRAVLGRYGAGLTLEQAVDGLAPKAPSDLRPELLAPARELATRIVTDGFRRLRVSRWLGWLQLATSVAAVIYGIGVLAAGWGSNQLFGADALIYGAWLGLAGVFTALIIPRRGYSLAQRYLATTDPARPRV